MKKKRMNLLGYILLFSVSSVHAGVFHNIVIGDKDNFGYGTEFQYLPDLNNDNKINRKDKFDLRDHEEIRDVKFTGSDYKIHRRTFGSSFTDRSLYKVSNKKIFKFDFIVDEKDLDLTGDYVLNLVFADYDVSKLKFKITYRDSEKFYVTPQRQNNRKGEDGLVQKISVDLAFDHLFTKYDEEFRGFLIVELKSFSDPHFAIDYAEIADRNSEVSEPNLMFYGLFLGIISLLIYRNKRFLDYKAKS